MNRVYVNISIFLFTISLFGTAFVLENSRNYIGLEVLLFGWIMTFNAILYIPTLLTSSWTEFHVLGYLGWLANPLLVFSTNFFLSEAYRSSFITSIIAFILGWLSLILQSITISQSGNTSNINHMGIGFILWMLSISSMLFISAYSFFKKRSSKRSSI